MLTLMTMMALLGFLAPCCMGENIDCDGRKEQCDLRFPGDILHPPAPTLYSDFKQDLPSRNIPLGRILKVISDHVPLRKFVLDIGCSGTSEASFLYTRQYSMNRQAELDFPLGSFKFMCIDPFSHGGQSHIVASADGQFAKHLEKHNVPRDIDVFRNDADSFDCHVLHELIFVYKAQPKLVWMEINPAFPPPIEFGAVQYDAGDPLYDSANNLGGEYHPVSSFPYPQNLAFGCSAALIERILRPAGYRLLQVDWYNVAYVKAEYLPWFGQKLPTDVYTQYQRGYIERSGIRTKQSLHKRHLITPLMFDLWDRINAGEDAKTIEKFIMNEMKTSKRSFYLHVPSAEEEKTRYDTPLSSNSYNPHTVPRLCAPMSVDSHQAVTIRVENPGREFLNHVVGTHLIGVLVSSEPLASGECGAGHALPQDVPLEWSEKVRLQYSVLDEKSAGVSVELPRTAGLNEACVGAVELARDELMALKLSPAYVSRYGGSAYVTPFLSVRHHDVAWLAGASQRFSSRALRGLSSEEDFP